MGIREFLAENNIAVLAQPLYSPDLAPSDFFSSPKLKEVIKGTRFQESEAIKTAVTRECRDRWYLARVQVEVDMASQESTMKDVKILQ